MTASQERGKVCDAELEEPQNNHAEGSVQGSVAEPSESSQHSEVVAATAPEPPRAPQAASSAGIRPWVTSGGHGSARVSSGHDGQAQSGQHRGCPLAITSPSICLQRAEITISALQ